MSKRLSLVEELIAKGSRDPFVWYGRAMELRSLGRLDDALAAFADVEREFPSYVPTFLMAAQVAKQLGDDETARGWLLRGTEKAKVAGDDHALSEIQALLGSL